MVKIREFIHENPLTGSEVEMFRESRADASEIKRLQAELESTIRREGQERNTGFAWMDKCKAAEQREAGLLHHLRRTTKDPVYKTTTDHAHYYEVAFWDIEEARHFLEVTYPEKPSRDSGENA